MGVRVTHRIGDWSAKTQRRLDVGLLDLVTTIHRDAGNLAPRDTGNLVASGRIKRNGAMDYSVIFGGGAVQYARRRHFENKRNPQTLNYLKRAGDNNARNLKTYLKGI